MKNSPDLFKPLRVLHQMWMAKIKINAGQPHQGLPGI